MSHSRRQSLSSSWIENHGSWMDTLRMGSQSPVVQISSPGPGGRVSPAKDDLDTWIRDWERTLAGDLTDSRVVAIAGDASVEDACEKLLKEDIPCLVVISNSSSIDNGLFDFSDVNSFLTLAATCHTLNSHEPEDETATRASDIIEAAKAGHVPVHLVSNFSQKNPLEMLPHEANVIDLLRLFSRGVHRALISSPAPSLSKDSNSYSGLVSDRALLAWFSTYASRTPSFLSYLNNTLHALHLSSPPSPASSPLASAVIIGNDFPQALPSLYIYSDVITATADQPVLDAMKLMSDEGVSSVAVIDNGASGEGGPSAGGLVSAVSVTDVGKIVVPSESKQILYMPLHQFIALIKEPYGSTDGEETYPVYSLYPSSRLSYAIDKLLATNSHRLFITEESRPPSNSASPLMAPVGLGHHNHAPGIGLGLGRAAGTRLSGIVSIVDVLTVFAYLARIPSSDIDPTRQKRHRRMSSTSSTGSSPSHSLSSSLSDISGVPDALHIRHGTRRSISPGVGLGMGVAGMGSSLGRSTSRSSLRSAGGAGQRVSGSFVLPGPVIHGQPVLFGEVGSGSGNGGNSGSHGGVRK